MNKSHLLLTSTRPNITPAAIVPIPAIKNGIDTCINVFHHSSCLITLPSRAVKVSSPPFSDPGSGSDDATDVVMIELSEPVVECGNTGNFALSLSVIKMNKKRKLVKLKMLI